MGKLRLHIPQYDRAVFQFIDEVNRKLLALDSILHFMPLRATMHSGPSRNVRNPVIVDQPMHANEQILSIEYDVIRNTDIDKFTKILWEFTEITKRNIIPMMLTGISEVVDAIGNTVDAEDQGFSFDLLNQALEKLRVDFDEDGNPILPTLVVNPNMYERIKDIKPTPEQAQRFREIIEAKKEEHDAQKRSRRLS